MRKKFSMLALIVLLVFQTMITPVAATAKGLEVQENSDPHVMEDVNVGEVDDLEEGEGSENEGTDGDEGNAIVDPDDPENKDDSAENGNEDGTDDDATAGDSGAGEGSDNSLDEPDTTEADEDIGNEQGEDSSDNFFLQSSGDAVVANDVEPREITDNIIDEIILKRGDGSIYEDGDQLDPNEDLELGLEWSLPNDPMYVGGDTFTFQLPKQLAIYSEITGDLDDFGEFVVTEDGKVTFTFNDLINENSGVKGTFWVKTELEKQKVTSSTEELEIVFNEDVAKKITINVKPEDGQAIHKEGQPVNGSFNTDEIVWTVLINTTKDALENAIVHDPIGDGQELDLDSIELKEIEVNLAGEKIADLGSVDLTNVDKSTVKELKLELGDTNKAYELTFKTKMEESEKDREGWLWYSNTAHLNSDGKDQKESAAGVSVQRPESLTKTSSEFDAEDRSVEWTVNANFTEKQLKAGDTITDEFNFTVGGENKNDVFTVIEDNIKIEQVDSFDNNGNPTEKSDAKNLFDIDIDGNKVTYTLKEDTSSAFIIKYKTIAEDGAYINKNGEISNKIEIDGKTADSSQGVHQQVGDKWIHEINYETKEIEWKIRVNADKQDLKNFILTDNFSGAGQKLVENSIDIDPDTSGAQISPDADGEGFKIDFGDIKDTYLITYKTKFTYDFADEDKPNFKNGLNIKYDTGDPDNPYELEIEREREPNEETRNNGVKNGTANNETKEITWTVDVNYNNLTLTNAKVIDVIADNQSLIDGSVKVYETSIDSDGNITTGDDVTENFNVTAEENLVEVLFNGEINQSHRVEFKTKDKDDIYNSDEVYENTAQFIPREGEEHNLKATVTLPNQGEFLGKSGLHNKNDWTVDWKIDVNQSQSKLNGVTVKDDLGDDGSQILLEDSFKVTKAGSDEELDEDVYELTIDGNAFSIKFDGEITDAYEITYSSYILAGETADLKNKAEIESVEETIVGNVEKEEVVEVKMSTGGGTAEGATAGLTLEKTEKGTDRPLENVKFTLLTTIGNQEIVVREGTTDEEGKLEWTGLRYGDYTLKEEIPEGYTGEETQEVTIDNDSLEDGVLTLKDEIVNERQTGTAKIIKTDAVTGEELPGATFEITNETTGQKYTLTTEGDGTISEEVPFGDYTVEEITAPNGYRIIADIENITIEIDETTEVTIENEAFVDITGQKTWISDNNLDLPEITVELLANGDKEDQATVSIDTDWAYNFTDLDKYDENGEEIEYTIEEVEVEGFITEQDGFDLTNIQTVDISGEKNWVEVDEQYRPDSITVNLLAGEEEVASKEVEADDEGEWNFTFEGLPKYDIEENEIEYTIAEVDITGYTSEVVDFTITNTQETTELSGTKTWLDDNSENRPEAITVQVKNGNTVVQEKDVAADDEGEWNYTFTDLPKYDKEGNEITYTIDEEAVEGYEKSIIGNNITNLRVGETEVVVTKLWNDEDENDRPETITINLLQNGGHYDEYEIKAEDGWERTITGLPQYDEEGVEYEYTITEHDVAGYAANVDGFNVTNTRADVKTIEINKSWLDDDSEDRPGSIQVELFRSVTDGDKELVDTYTVEADNNWSLEITDLPAFDNDGNAYTYEIEEIVVEGYKTTINGFDITNLRAGTTEVEVTKLWKDEDETERPETITINLLQNGEQYEEYEVTAENNWALKIEGLPHYDEDGVAYEYTVTEHDVPGYASDVDGFDITNTRTDVKTIEITKSWLDDDSVNRPNSIEVELYRSVVDGEKELVETYTVTADDWSLEISDLPSFNEDGNAYTYEIEEKAVEGYETSINGFELTNLRVDKTEVTGTKTWLDDDSQDRPEAITVYLLANGDKVDEVDVTAESNWTYEFAGLDKYDDQGVEITYTVDEEAVEDYEKSIQGNDITNLRVGTTEVEITKLWKDEQETDRPETITVQLKDGEEIVQEQEVAENEDGEWKYTFTNLPKFNEEGKEINYTVQELAVDGYNTEVVENAEGSFTITNTQKTYAIGDYTWIDSNKDGIQDEDEDILTKVKVELFDEEGEFIAKTETDENGRYIFDELPAGNYQVKFTLTEEQAKKYKFTKQNADDNSTQDSDADPETGFTKIIKLNDENEYLTKDYKDQDFKATEGIDPTWDAGVIELVDITITKQWVDKGQSIRPDVITVDLLANGEKISDHEVTADSTWTLTIEGLDKYDTNGEEIVYTIEEHTVSEYNTSIDGFDITNTRKTYAIGDYTWIDSNKDGIQDEDEEPLVGVKVELFDGKGEKVAETTTDKNGRYIFDELESGNYKVKFTLTEEQAKKYKFTKQNAGKDSVVDSDADENGWTKEISLNEGNEQLTKEYEDQAFNATEGIDPTWDAGVIEKTTPEEPTDPEDPELGGDGGEKDPEDPTDIDGAGEGGDVEAGGGTGQTVPATATNIYNLALIGFGLMLLGLIIFLARRKRIE